ncbi:peptidoglycan hydrolase-like protein with peptidoglycan-binding domain [Actinokineospora baliensis]|uniref:peptidoglycan-binding domain-containing protein n=1 Tax=Actinokineospora baliensis TaxID=547056 RepID=UPI0019575A0E|nr:peptidoglycan-binding protein [Actinokineospora baliensis]MBM7770619.1 peptidoglycan hydrolase-like protein with peptidoglycan-binding domain [Actinokineospora baliensis]
MSWRVARSLDALLGQLDSLAPRRNRASDGAIGDTSHSTRDSDHNPWVILDGVPVVTARDFTHDPDGGLDCGWLAGALTGHADPRIKYVIWSGHIWYPKGGWSAYTGANAHTHHLHLSVVAGPAADDTTPWNLGGTNPAPQPQPVPANPGGRATLRQGSTGEDVRLVQRYLGLPADGVFGPATRAKVLSYQRSQGLTADGIVGPGTWGRILAGLGVGGGAAGGGGTAPAPVTPRPTLRRGATGDHVRVLQRWLGLPVDGVFGPATEAKVRRYQAAHALTADGIVGPRTWAAMHL